MADDSFENLEERAFHPADPPHGLRNYDIGSLKPDQQKTLNKMKMIQRIENEKYFKAHPEIRGLISILLRHILMEQPSSNVHEIAGAFFTRPKGKIVMELMDYLVDNCHSEPIIDVLRKEMMKRHDVPDKINPTNIDESIEAVQKISSSSSEIL